MAEDIGAAHDVFLAHQQIGARLRLGACQLAGRDVAPNASINSSQVTGISSPTRAGSVPA